LANNFFYKVADFFILIAMMTANTMLTTISMASSDKKIAPINFKLLAETSYPEEKIGMK
jgi:hypothetical protein